jgi:iron complex transport system substrate-binding protein
MEDLMRFASLLTLTIIFLLITACHADGSYNQSYPFTIEDSAGRKMTIDKPVTRVVCTATQHLETLRSLKVPKELIVGTPDIRGYSYFSDFEGRQRIGQFFDPDVEKIISLKPDVVIVHPGPGPMGNSLDPAIKKLQDAGMKILLFYCNRPDIYMDEVEKLGILFGKANEAERFLDFYKGSLRAVEDKIADLPEGNKPSVYCEWNPYTTSDLDLYPISMAGGSYIFAGREDIRDVDPESVVSLNPDIIVRLVWNADYDGLEAGDNRLMKEARDEILSRPELQNVNAVREGKVYVMAAPLWVYLPYSSCRDLVGIAYLAKWFHPDLFSDLDPQAIHQRYLADFQGLDYQLTDRGVFVYPEEP